MPSVSVIVLNYNGRQWIEGCLAGLRAQCETPVFETLFVDNGSRDNSVNFVRTEYPDVRIVDNHRNLGFAGGNNAGARHAAGEWLAFLNNDTIPDPRWLAALWNASRSNAEYGIVTSRLVFMDDPSVIDSAGDGYLRAGGAFKHGHGARSDAFAQSREVFGACGGAFMIRRDLFETLGGFDERFFMVYEDVDLSYRARLRGARVWYAADAIVRHAGSGSLGMISPNAVFYSQRNLEWTWIKNTPRALLASTAFSHLIFSAAGALYYIRIGRGAAAIRGKWAAIRELGAVLADRRRVQATAMANANALEALMEPRWLEAKRREKAYMLSRAGTPSAADSGVER